MTLTPEDVEAILKECPSVRYAAPIVRARAQVVYGNQTGCRLTSTAPRLHSPYPRFDRHGRKGEAFTDHEVRT